MTDAVGISASRCASGRSPPPARSADFGATGKTITDPGFLRAYVESSDDENAEAEDAERRLPTLVKDQPLTADELAAQGHHTQPPSRYTEASLVKALEELGIGRPSTYASIMQTIQDRGYVTKRGQALIPSFLAFAVIGLLERHYPRLVDYDFTAAMENELDEIAGGDHAAVDFLTRVLLRQRQRCRRPGHRPRRRPEEAGHREPRRHRRPRRSTRSRCSPTTTAARSWSGSAATGRTCSGRCPAASSRHRRRGRGGRHQGDRAPIPEGLAPDELTPEKVARAVPRRRRRAQARRAPGDRRADRAQVRPVRPVRVQRRAERRRCCSRSRPDSLTLEEALQAAHACPGWSARTPDGVEIFAGQRPLRPVRQAGRRLPFAGVRGADVHGHPGRGAGAAGRAEDPRSAGPPAPPLREMGVDPVDREADGDQGRPVRPVRDRRRVQRVAAARADAGGADRRARRARCWPRSGRRARRREEGGGEEGAPAKKATATKTTAARRPRRKKTTAAKKTATAQEGRRPRRPPAQEGDQPTKAAAAKKADRPPKADRGRPAEADAAATAARGAASRTPASDAEDLVRCSRWRRPGAGSSVSRTARKSSKRGYAGRSEPASR